MSGRRTGAQIKKDAVKKGVDVKKIKTSGASKRLDTTINKTNPQLKKDLKDMKIKGYSKFNKKELLNKVVPETESISDLLRARRIINLKNNTITQYGILGNVNYTTYKNNGYAVYIHKNIKKYIFEARDHLFKDTNVIDSFIKPLYVYDEAPVDGVQPAVVKFGSGSENLDKSTDSNDLELLVPLNQSMDRFLYIGFQIVYQLKNGSSIKKRNLNLLRAYSQSTDYKYHKVTTASTSTAKICIYETFLHIEGIKKLQYSHRDNAKYKKELYDKLKEEGKEIEEAVKAGEVVNSLKLLSQKYNTCVLFVFYGYFNGLKSIDDGDYSMPFEVDYDLLNEFPLWFKNGEMVEYYEIKELDDNKHEITFDKDLILEIRKMLNDKEVFLYNQEHVSPSLCSKYVSSRRKELSKKLTDKENFVYKLSPSNNKNIKVIQNVLGFDIETYTDKNHKAIPYNLTVYGVLTIKKLKFNNKEIKLSFYGLDCVDKFVEFLESISTPTNNMKKSKAKNKDTEGKILVYGFNNSNFDNLLTIKTLHDKLGYERNIISGNSVKTITFCNVKIMDIACYYVGTLASVAGPRGFNLDIVKGVFPYTFPNKDNLQYVGCVPDLKYWNTEADRETYIKENGDTFYLKQYTEKYCMLDSKLVYQIAIKHLKNCVGKINDRQYDTRSCPTGANIALKMFQQCFLEDTLTSSPKQIRDIERESYFGGRTEVFKKEYGSAEQTKGGLYYLDINSAHPSGMLKTMPFKYQKTLKIKKPGPVKAIVDYYLYHVKVTYNGNDKNYIPNLLQRDGKNIIGVKNTNYIYCWGIELKEAVLDGCSYLCDAVLMYEGKDIFKGFATYFYNERLKIKKTNPTLSQYYKLVMNSLYGKFGQQPHTTKVIIKHPNEISRYVKDNCQKVVNINVIDDDYMILEYADILDDVNNVGNLVRFSSYIACTTRCKLSEIKRDVGHKNIFYCDTDSIFSNKRPSKKYMDDNILGKWKVECAPICEAYFLAPKMYYYRDEDNDSCNKAKGIKAGELNKDDYTNMLHNGELVGQNKLLFYKSLDGVKIESVTRNVKCVYNKRKWNGNDSEAFENIEEWKLN